MQHGEYNFLEFHPIMLNSLKFRNFALIALGII